MTYINPVYTYGKERFMKRCVECGIDGIIVPDLPYEEKEDLSEKVEALIKERAEARKEKNYKRADEIRDELKAMGIVLEDTSSGVKWKKI